MTYLQVSLPAPAANGSGAAVDVSAFGALKSITVTAGGNSVLQPSVIVEMSNEAAPTKWAPVAFFQPSGEESIEIAARWMRATVTNYKTGGAPTVEVGGQAADTDFANLPVPAASGLGAGVDTSSLGPFKTVHVGGTFRGALNILVSQDGGATYQQAMSFQSGQAGAQSAVFAADYMRVQRAGVPEIDPGTPVVNVGGTESSGGSVGSTAQVFRYVATGAEGDSFTVPLPEARANASYNVQITMGGPIANANKVVRAIASTFTTTEFDVELSADAEAGDILMFTVEDLS